MGEGVSLGAGVGVGVAAGSGVSVGAALTTIGVTSIITGASVGRLVGAIGDVVRVGDAVASSAATRSAGLPARSSHAENRTPAQISASARAAKVTHSFLLHWRGEGLAVNTRNARAESAPSPVAANSASALFSVCGGIYFS